MLPDSKTKVIFLLVFTLLVFIPSIASFAETVIYNYDDLNRLKWVQYGDGTIIEYSYDEVGNRAEKDIISFTQDTDGDTLTNLQEYQLGTNPFIQDTDGDSINDNIDACPTYPPIWVSLISTYYPVLQSAYNAAAVNDIILSHATSFTENPDFNLSKSITLDGGYNCDYTSKTEKTRVKGMLKISKRTVRIKNLVVGK